VTGVQTCALPISELTDEIAPAEEPITADTQKQSNIRLVFGDDDIPYIVETSGLELVDEDIDSVLNIMRTDDDEPAALEELDEEADGITKDSAAEGGVEELEELEEIESSPDLPSSGILSEEALDNLTREIEYSVLPSTDLAEEPLDNEFEIVSPFATILSDFSDEKDAGGENIPDTEESLTEESLGEEEEPETFPSEEAETVSEEIEANPEELHAQGPNEATKPDELQGGNTGSLIYKPFTTQDPVTPENLEALQDEDQEEEVDITELTGLENTNEEDALEPSNPQAIIEERDGISYVNKDILNPDEETVQKLDPGFKNLINSVLKKE
jgi:hypothetical protein